MFDLKKQYTPSELEQLLMRAANLCSELSIDFVHKKTAYEDSYDYKKVKFALLLDTIKEGKKSDKEHAVLISKEWDNYITVVSNSHYDYLHAQAAYDNAIRDYETIRSLLSSKNTERRTGI